MPPGTFSDFRIQSQLTWAVVRSFGTRFISRPELMQTTGLAPNTIDYSLRLLKRLSLIDKQQGKAMGKCYYLAVLIEDAVRELHARGFSPVALAG